MSPEQQSPYEPSAGAIYWGAGTVLGAIGIAILFNATYKDELALLGGALVASGTYLIIAGAVARGVQLARMAAAKLADTGRHAGAGPAGP